MKKKLLLTDFSNSLHTLHHRKVNDLSFTFLRDIRSIIAQFKIDRVLLLPEGGKSSYRLKLYPEYKGQRKDIHDKKTPEEQARYKKYKEVEEPETLELLKLHGLYKASLPKIEADDMYSAIIRHIDLEKWQVCGLSTDKDMLQLLRPGVVQGPYNSNTVGLLEQKKPLPADMWLNTRKFIEKYEIEPTLWSHFKALAGDSGDNYFSPKGLGETFALRLVKEFGTIDKVEQNFYNWTFPRFTDKIKDAMKADYQDIYRNLKLAELNHSKEVDLEIFGIEGLEYIKEVLVKLEEPHQLDSKAIGEYFLEFGKLDEYEALDEWLAPFTRP